MSHGLFLPLWIISRCLKLKKSGSPWKNDYESNYGLKAADLYLVPNFGLPINFKSPEFDKYKRELMP
ncbi:hypothetical protein CR513_26538, partial [Mucuna pruriens]